MCSDAGGMCAVTVEQEGRAKEEIRKKRLPREHNSIVRLSSLYYRSSLFLYQLVFILGRYQINLWFLRVKMFVKQYPDN